MTLTNAVTLGGTLTFSGSHALTFSGAVNLGGADRTIDNSIPADLTFSGAISNGSLTIAGSAATGAVILSGNNSHTNTTVSGGNGTTNTNTLSVASDDSLGTGTVTLNGAGSILKVTGATTIDNALFIGSSGGKVENTAAATLSGIISGSGALNKQGAGTLTLTGTNTHTGSVTVGAGTLALSGGSSIGNDSAVTVEAGATLSLTGGGETIGSLAGAGNVSLTYALTVGNASDTTFSGVISSTNTSGIVKVGAGTLTLSGANTYTGSTTLSAGGLSLSGGAAIADAGAVTVASGATLTLNASETIGSLGGEGAVALGANTLTAGGNDTSTSFSGVIGGTGGLTKAGTGTFTLSGANTYEGATTVSAGLLVAAHNTALGTTTGATTVATGASLGFSGGVTVADAVTVAGAGLSSGGALYNVSGSNTLSGAVTATANFTLGASAGTLTLGGQISAAGSTLTKSGSGTVVLGGTGSTTGGIAVDAGTLLVTGGVSGNATVSAGTLGGTGTVTGNVTVASGATLAPGVAGTNNGIGMLTIAGDLTLAGTLSIDLAGTAPNFTAGTDHDQVSVSGAVTLTTASAAIAVPTYSVTGGSNNSFVVVNQTGAGTITGTLNGVAEGGSFTSNSRSFRASYAGGTGNDLTLNDNSPPSLDLNGAADGTGATVTLADAGGSLASATASDADANWNGGTLTVRRVTAGGTADGSVNDVFSFLADVVATGTIAKGADSTGTLTSGGTAYATWSYTSASGLLSITFNGNATSGNVQTLVRNIGYANATPYGDATIRFTLADAAASSTTADLTVTSSVIYADLSADSDSDGDAADGFSLREALARGAAQAGADTVKVKLADNSTVTLGSGVTSGAGDTLDFDEANGVTIAGSTITLGGALSLSNGTGDTATVSAPLAGSAALTKAGAGTVTLSGTNTRTGATTVSAGTLALSGGSSLDDAAAATVSTGATLSLGADEAIGSLDGGGTVALGSHTLTVGGADTSTSFSGVIGGTGGLTKAGTGTLTLTGVNTYTGATTVSAGGLTLDNASGTALADGSAVSVTGTLTLSSAAETIGALSGTGTVAVGANALTVSQTTDTSFTGGLTSSAGGSLTKAGNGTLTLQNAANRTNFLGATTVSGGTLAVGKGSPSAVSGKDSLGAGALTLDGGTLSVSGQGQQVFAQAVTIGSGGGTIHTTVNAKLSGQITAASGVTLTKTGSGGVLTLSNTSNSTSFAGNITVAANGSALEFGDSSGISAGQANTGTITLGASTTLQLPTLGSAATLTLGNAVVLTGNATVQTSANVLTLSGAVTGSFSLSKFGSGTLALGGTNGYGATSVSGGTLSVGADGNLGSGTVTLNGANVTLLLGDGAAVNNAVAIGTDGGRVTVASGAAAGLSGVISGSGALTKDGEGTLTLSGNNTHSGSATVSAGILVAGHNNALGNTTGATTVSSGATLRIGSGVTVADAVTISGTGAGGIGALHAASGTGTLSGAVTLAADATLGAASGATLALTGGITDGSSTFNLTKAGEGTVALTTSASSYDGTTTVSAGTLSVDADSRLGTGKLTLASGTIFQVTAATTIDNAIELTGAATIRTDADVTLQGALSGGAQALSKTGTGKLTLTNTGNEAGLTGGVTVSAGTLAVSADDALVAGTVTLNGGTLSATSAATIDNDMALGSGGGTIDLSTASLTLAGVISGSGALAVGGTSATNVLTLSASNTNSGGVTLNNGVVQVGSNTALGTGTLSVLGGGIGASGSGSFTLANAVAIGGTFTMAGSGALTFTGTVNLGGATRTVNNSTTAALTFGGVIGNGGLTVASTGTGKVFLTAANTHAGGTSVTAGTLSVSADANLGTGSLTLAGGTLEFTGTGAQTVAKAITLGTGGGTILYGQTGSTDTLTLSGAITGSTTLTKAGAGTVDLTGSTNNSSAWATSVQGGVVMLTADVNLGSSAVTLAADTALRVKTSTTIHNNTTLTGNASVQTDEAVTISGTLAANGFTLRKIGTGTLTVSGATGGMTVNAGNVAIGSASALSGAVTLDGGTLAITATTATAITNDFTLGSGHGTLDTAGPVTLSGAITGSGNLVKTGTGTLTLTGANSFSGTTTISGGRLAVNGSITGTGAVSVASGGTLGGTGTLAGAVSVASGGTIGAGNSPGTLTLNNGLTIASGGTLSAELDGTTAGTGYDQIVVTGTVTITGATLTLTAGFTPAQGDSFTLIDNDGSDLVTGTFSGLAEGGLVTVGTKSYRISYAGGTGNDVVLTVVPAVTDANISISGATGTGGAFRIGDTVTATWNSTSAGDNNSALTGVTVDFSQFGGGSAVSASNSSGTWTATYTIAAGTIETTGRNVSVTASGPNGTSTTAADTTGASVDTATATVTNVTSTTTDGSYKAGDTVSIQVEFNQAVTVTGTPQLTLETGTTDRAVNYVSGSGTSTLTFTYTVQAGDTSADLDFASAAALALNGGTILDSAGNAATLTLATPGATGSLGANKAIVIDTTAPTLGTAALTAATDSGSSSADGITNATNPAFSLTVGEAGLTLELLRGTTVVATATSTAGTNTLTHTGAAEGTGLSYTVRATDAAGNQTTSNAATVTIDRTAPTISDVANQTIEEDAATGALSVTVGDGVTSAGTVQLTRGSGNASLVADSAIVLGGSGANRTVTVTPTGNQFGSSVITLTVTDEAGNTATDSFTVTVNAVAETPTVSGATSTTEDTLSSAIAITRSGTDGSEITHFKISSITGGTLYKDSAATTAIAGGDVITAAEAATVYFRPSSNANTADGGTFSFQVQGARDSAGNGLSPTPATVTLTVSAANDAPTIGGAGTQSITDKQTALPFASILFADVDSPDQTQTVTVTLDAAAKGSFTTLNGFTSQGGGVYTYTGIASAAQAAIRGLVFTPADNRVNPGSTETTTFTVTISDGNGGSASDSSTQVTTTAANDAPQLGGAASGQPVSDKGTLQPFQGFTVTDADTSQALTLTVGIDVPGRGTFSAASLTASGFTQAGTGSFTFAGTASAAQAALRQLVYTPTENLFAPGTTETVRFTVTALDASGSSASDDTTTVLITSANDGPAISGISGAIDTTDRATATPFPDVVVTDADRPNQTLTATVTIDPAKGSLNGTYDAAAGVWSFTGTAAQVQAALRAIVFTPTENRVTPGTVETTMFTLEVSDGTFRTADSLTSVRTLSVNDAPFANRGVSRATATQGSAFSLTLPTSTFGDPDDGDPLTGTATLTNGNPLPAWLTFDSETRTFSGTPGNGDVGTLTIRLTVTDLAGASASDIFILTVANVNDAPVATDDRVSTGESSAFTLSAARGLLSNDADPDTGDTRVVSLVNGLASSVGRAITLAGGGQVTIRQNGSVAFDPNGAYAGLNAGETVVEQVRYTIVDAGGLTSTATLFITVEGRNNGPVLQPDKIVTIDQDSSAIGLSITRPVDAEGDPLTITITALPSAGTVRTAEGTVVQIGALLSSTQLANLTYTPPAGFSGDAGTLAYSVSDGGAAATQAVGITVTAVQRLDVVPVATVASEGTAGNTVLTFRITRTGDTSAETVVDWQIDNPTRNSGQADRDDFVGGLPFGKATLASGAGFVDVTITVAADTAVEPDETFTFSVTGVATSLADGKIVFQRETARGTILDDDRDVTPPSIVSVTAPAAGNYVDGDTLTFTVKFSEAIDRTNLGTPRLALTIGRTTRFAELVEVAGQPADTLTFAYTVTPSDADKDGISVGQNINLNGGRIRDAAGNNAARNLGALRTGDVIVNTFKGVVVDGYITGGTVFADANRNSVLDEGESFSTTDGSGNFEILGGSGPYILVGGRDISTGLDFKGIFEAPPRAKVINPLTTLLVGVAGLSATDPQIAAAQTAVKTALGIDAGIDLLTYDPIVEATTAGRSAGEISTAVAAQAEAAKIANLLVQGSSVLAGAASTPIDSGDAGRAVLAALAETVSALPSGATIDLSSQTVIEAVLRNAAARLSGIDADRVAAVAADAARVIGASNGAVDTATAGSSGDALENLTRITQAQVVAQGSAATALQEGTAGSGLTGAVDSFTGTNLDTQVDQATVGVVVPSRLAIAAADAAKSEGDAGTTAYTFTVTRSGNLSGALSVDWQVTGTDSLDADDFGGALPGGTVSFADGETVKTITVSIAGDQAIEADETFGVVLSNPTASAALATDAAFGVILNDDPAAPRITLPGTASVLAGAATAIEGISVADGNSATVTVSLTPVNGSVALTGPATVTASGNALSVTGSVADVNATLATLRFTGDSGSATGAIDVAVSDGDAATADASERLSVSILSAPENTLPARPTVVAGVSSEIFGISVADTDSGSVTVTLTPSQGTVTVTQFGSATVTSLSDDRVQVSGTVADVNQVLASLEFTAQRNVLGASLLITTADADELTADDSDLLSIDVVSSPESAVSTAQTVVAGVPQAVPGITVGDFDTAELQVTLVPANGQIGIDAVGSAVLTRPNDTTLRLTGTIADLNASLATLTFTGTIGSTAGSVQVLTTDRDALTPDPTATVEFTILNAPTLDLPGQPSVVAGTTVSLSGITVADADPGEVTVTLAPTGGTLAAAAAAGATVSTASDGTLTITGAVATVNSTLAGLTFTAGRAGSGANIVLSVSDGDSRTADAQATLSITITGSVELQLPSDGVVLAAGTEASLAGISLSDAGTDLVTVRLTATNGVPVLAAQGGAAVADLGGGLFTLIGNSSDINATLAGMTFNGTQGETEASLRIQIDFTDPSLAAIDETLAITLVNPPVVTLPAEADIHVTAGQTGAIPGISVADFDDADLTVTVAPSGGTVGLVAAGSAVVTAGADGSLTVSGTKEDVNATLSGLTFTPAAGAAAGSVTLTAGDSDPVSPDVTATLAVTVVSPSQVTLPAGGTAIAGVPMELHGFSISDADSASVTATLVPTGGTVEATASGSAVIVLGTDGLITVTGSPADVTATLETLRFTMTAGATAPSLQVSVSDGDSRTEDTSATIALTVSTSQPPAAGGDITATATDNTTLFLPEDSAAPGAANIRLAPSVVANGDGHSPDAIRILSASGGTLTLADGTTIVLGASGTVIPLTAGVVDLRFTPASDRDTAATLRYVMVDTVRGTPNSAASTATIAITPVNDLPTGSADSGAVGAGGTLSVTASAGLLANDRDSDTGDSLIVSEVEGSAARVGQAFTLPSGARLTVNADGSYSYDANGAFASLAAGTTGTDSFTYTARDSAGGTATATVTLTITGVNDTPVATDDALGVAADATLTGDASGLLANDGDPDTGDTLRVATVNGATDAVGRQITLPSGALLRLNADGSYSYDPNGRYDRLPAGTTATDSFTYTVRDAAGATASATATITVQGVNDAPAAAADTAVLTENSVFNVAGVGVLVNDIDIDTGDTLTVSAVNGQTASVGQTITLASGARLLMNAEGSYRYDTNGAFRDLAQGQSRTDSFTYTVRDAAGATSTATVTLTITGVNNAPAAVADGAATAASQVVTATGAAGLLANDTDADSGDGARRVTAVNGSAADVGGTVTLASGAKLTVAVDGSYVYDPNGAFNTLGAGQTTTDSFTYTVADGFGGTAVGRATITITGVNDGPTAAADSATVTEKTTLSVPTLGVLANDTDINQGDSLTVSAVNGSADSVGRTVTLASGAKLTLNADGSYVYDPNGRFTALNLGQSATDSFTYTASDRSGATSTATVVVTITGINDAPVPQPDPGTVFEDSAVSVSAAAGVLSNLSDADQGDTATVTAVNGSGSAVGQAITLDSGALLTVNADGSYRYDPNGRFESLAAGATTTDSFTATVRDAGGATATATVTLTIIGANDAPVARADALSLGESDRKAVAASAGVLSNDSDADAGAALAVSAVGGQTSSVGQAIALASGARITLNADGSYVYDTNGAFSSLAAGQSTTDSVGYTVSDGKGGSATATLTLTITGANAAPAAVADAVEVAEDAALAVPAKGLLANDTDADAGAKLTVTAVQGDAAAVGTAVTLASGVRVTVAADGSYTVDTAGNYDGLAAGETVTEQFGYTVSDGQGGSTAGTATITIVGTNDAPVLAGAIAAQGAREAEAFGLKLAAGLFADADVSDTVTLSADLASGAALPGWLKFDAATGTFSGTPGSTDVGQVTVRVTATDPSGATASTSFTLTTEAAPKVVTPVAKPAETVPAATPTTVQAGAPPAMIILPLVQSTSTLSASPSSLPSSLSSPSSSGGTEAAFSGTFTLPAGQSELVSIGTRAADGLQLLNGIPDRQFGTDGTNSFRLPSGVFGHSDPTAVITIEATLADGSPLPSWLKFDATSGTFSGTPPADTEGQLEIRVKARDNAGTEVVVDFKLKVGDSAETPATEQAPETAPAEGQKNTDAAPRRDQQETKAPLAGKPSLTAQLKAAGQEDLLTEGMALLESLLKAAGLDSLDRAA
ncbi:Ig-like domain-containing protein [Skermanella mucosa]|nr:Ig-like domain-containing protein [Skermanella mucosa]